MHISRIALIDVRPSYARARWALWRNWHFVLSCSIFVVCALLQIQEAVAGEPPVASKAKNVTTAGNDSPITLVFGGDAMLGRLVNDVILERGPYYIWGNILPLLLSADVTLVNLECVIAKGGTPFVPPRVFYFRANPRAVEALSVAGIDFVSLANNHAMDFQTPALLETIEHLDRAGIAHAGAGRNLEAASRSSNLEVQGMRIGVIAFADHFREYGAGEDSAGTNIIEVDLLNRNFDPVRTTIQKARDEGADLVIFSIHWGPNMRQVPTMDFVKFSHAVVDAGVDIFYGHSAHIFQGIEVYKGKLILFDTGDLIDDYYVDQVLRNDQQLLFIIKATRAGIQRVEMVPLLIDKMQVNLAQGENFNAIQKRITRLSQMYGTEIYTKGDRLVIDISQTNTKDNR